MRKVIKILSDAVLAVIIGFALLIGGGHLIGVVPYVVLSGSMEPKIKTGSVCFVDTKAAFEGIKPGDVIAFETANGALVTHRVIKIKDGAMETKGDANQVTDGLTTTKENFRGKSVFSIPIAGYVISWVQTTRGKILWITGTITLLLGSLLMDETKKNKKRQEERGDA
jgi:signal peptidase